ANGRTIHTVSRPMADGGWVTTHEDVTDRISAERERDRNRDLLNLIVENVPVTIFVKNASDRRFILVNRACENVWGCRARKFSAGPPPTSFRKPPPPKSTRATSVC